MLYEYCRSLASATEQLLDQKQLSGECKVHSRKFQMTRSDSDVIHHKQTSTSQLNYSTLVYLTYFESTKYQVYLLLG